MRQDVLRMSREELEDKFLRLNDENLNLKQRINKQDDKIKRLTTRLMRLVKDRSRLEQLASGAVPHPGPRGRDVGMEELIEDLQDNIRTLHSENESLKQQLRVAKQQIIHQQGRRDTPYSHIHSRINSGIKKLRDTPSPSPVRPKSAKSSEGAGRPPTSQLPRYGHSLLEEARAKIRNLENVIESQRSHMEVLEGDAQLLRDELKKKEAEFEERLLDARQQQSSNLRTHVNSNVNMIKLQKQLAERSNTITELEGMFLLLQEKQQRLKASHDFALSKVDSLSMELKEERLHSLELEMKLKTAALSNKALHQLQEQISELEQERDLLKENNNKLLNSAFDVSQQQKWQIQEQKLKLQISQLETALQGDLVEKNEILDKVKAERETNERLTEENKKLHIQFLEQKQQLEEMKDQLKVYSKDSDYDVSELTEALLLGKKRKSQRNGDLSFLTATGGEVNVDNEVRELRAAYAETIQELEKTRSLLSVDRRICRGYKAELDTVTAKLKSDHMELEQRLETQAKLLDSRAARIRKLEAQLKDIAYGTKAYVFKPDVSEEEEAEEFSESLHLERGENVLELQAQDIAVTGVFELSDSSELPVGHIPLSLKWKFSYIPPPGSKVTVKPKFTSQPRVTEEETEKLKQEQPKSPELPEPVLASAKEEPLPESRGGPSAPMVHPSVGVTKAQLPKLRQRTLLREGPAAKKPVPEVLPPAGDEEEESSHFSEGQILASSSQSDDSDQISDHSRVDVQKLEHSQSTDSDDCIVQAQATGRKTSDRLRVEVVSLSLHPDSRVSQDASVVQLYVEYSLLDVPTEETPVSLPKPPHGHSINFNYSKVFPVDAENHSERRHLLRSALQGKSPHMETIRFTVVSEPLEEEQQEQECEEVGVAFLRIPEILQKQRDLNEAPLNVLDAEDQSEVIGVLTVSVEGLAALRSIMEDAQVD